jgi:hypothetical protein
VTAGEVAVVPHILFSIACHTSPATASKDGKGVARPADTTESLLPQIHHIRLPPHFSACDYTYIAKRILLQNCCASAANFQIPLSRRHSRIQIRHRLLSGGFAGAAFKGIQNAGPRCAKATALLRYIAKSLHNPSTGITVTQAVSLIVPGIRDGRSIFLLSTR